MNEEPAHQKEVTGDLAERRDLGNNESAELSRFVDLILNFYEEWKQR